MSVLLWMSLVVVVAHLDDNCALRGCVALQVSVHRNSRTHTHIHADSTATRPRAVFHVGVSKAGSTSLQATLTQHRSILAKDNVSLYPDAYPGEEESSFMRLLQDVSYCMLSVPRFPASQCNNSLSHFRAFLEGAQETNQDIVLSSEYFSMPSLNVTLLAEALNDFDASIIVFHRPYFEWIESWYSQAAKKISSPGKREGHISDQPLESFAMSQALVSASGLDSSSIAVYNRYSKHFGRVSMRALAPDFIRRFVCDDVQATALCSQLQSTEEIHDNARTVTTPRGGTRCMNASEKELFWTVSVSLEAQALALIGEAQMLNLTDLRARFDRSAFNFC
eukprot:TRINITY_DN750_c0_g1_i7.p1 TRINITY_DN750_c0_g1~~TRINITY_DN750_c0_g1_i7.p1  ORF type:complete len:360 (-),score=21.08 TRINITY_DN750_c0_g1_i7:69-1076(-)